MNKMNMPMLLCDFYKVSHKDMYPQGTEKVFSTWTCRGSRMKGVNKTIFFGLQKFVQEYLIEYFNDNFFNQPIEEIVQYYKDYMKYTLGKENADTTHIEDLHKLGYLPLKICAVKEGTRVPLRVPCVTIENTLPEFYWLTNFIETLMSAELWQPITSATISDRYREITDRYADQTVGNRNHVGFQCHDFSFRGMQGLGSAVNSGMAHLLSFTGTDTIPAIMGVEKYYDADIKNELVAGSVPACYDSITEILTENGWKLFKDLKEGEKVAQYHTDGSIDFVIPTAYYNMPYNGKMIHFDSEGYHYVDVMVTPNHRMIRRSKQTGEIEVFEADDKRYKFKKGYTDRNEMLVSGFAQDGVGMSAIDKLKVAFQADGSFPNRSECYTGVKYGTFPIRFSLKKERKKKRLIELCEEANIEYTLSEKDSRGYYSFWIKPTEMFSKTFDWIKLDAISRQWANDFIEELKYWDGSSKNNVIVYTSTIKENIDIIQGIAALCGKKTQYSEYKDKRDDYNRKISYTLSISNKDAVGGRSVIKKELDYNDTVHCVSVPTKMLIVRRNNVVCVSGNTEHSIMCSYGDANELELFKHIITNVHPTGIVSVVSDTWDFWKVMTEYLPQLKELIMNRDGKLTIRPDSGIPEDIICGTAEVHCLDKCVEDEKGIMCVAKDDAWAYFSDNKVDKVTFYYELKGKIYKADCYAEYTSERGRYSDNKYYIIDGVEVYIEEWELTAEEKGAIQVLWETFGGTINNLGYKELDSHVGLIYGDSITIERCEEICRRLKNKGFASSNIVLGVGSFSFTYNTRDTFAQALKATYAVVNGEERFLFKNPKTDDGTKKSQRGLVAVTKDSNGDIVFKDGLNREEHSKITDNMLEEVFVDGELVRRHTLSEIRNRVATNR